MQLTLESSNSNRLTPIASKASQDIILAKLPLFTSSLHTMKFVTSKEITNAPSYRKCVDLASSTQNDISRISLGAYHLMQ